MDSQTRFILLISGMVGALSKSYIHSVSNPTIWDETCTAWLTWVMIYSGLRLYRLTRKAEEYPPDPIISTEGAEKKGDLGVLITAAAAVAAQIFEAQNVLPLVSPLVTLLVICADHVSPSPTKGSYHSLDTPSTDASAPVSSPLDRPLWESNIPLWFPVNVALFVCMLCSSPFAEVTTSSYLYILSFVLAQATVYILLPRLSVNSSVASGASDLRVTLNLLRRVSMFSAGISTCVLALLSMTSIFESSEPISWIVIESSGQLLWWVSIFFLSMTGLSKSASTIGTVSASFDLVTLRTISSWKLLLSSSAAAGALWQLAVSATLNHYHRRWFYIAVVMLALVRLSLSWLSSGQEQAVDVDLISPLHPIEIIVNDAQSQLTQKVNSQSKTFEDAIAEYKRRYGRRPFPNFLEWFELAQKYDFQLIDEFDSAMRMLEPFWGLPPSTLRTLTESTLAELPDHFMRYEVSNHNVSVAQGHGVPWLRDVIRHWLPDGVLDLVPDLLLAINVFDEPSVCVAHDILEQAAQKARIHERSEGTPPRSSHFLDIGKQDVWEAVTVSCPVNSSARQTICNQALAEGKPLEFIQDIRKSKDICEHCELQYKEGFLMEPESLELTHSLTPIWSQGKISSFSDIVFPSPFYSMRSKDYIESEDPDWDEKGNTLYWVGAATGGHATENNWRNMQRQRLALMTASDSTAPIELLHQNDQGVWTPYNATMTDLPYFSTRISGTTSQCDAPACLAETSAFHIPPSEPKDPLNATYTHKLVLDLDGNSFSGRYYRLLLSKSTVLKQTLFEEWHDDRLVPWVHYVPISTGMEELGEVVRFLVEDERGREIAKRIAGEGRVWAGRALRERDMQLVWLRMLMEWGRIVSDRRDG